MNDLEYDTGLNVYALKCPWCGNSNAVDYESFGSATNGSESDTECNVCERPLHTTIDFQFTIRKLKEVK
jgi:hypothetical protein